MRPFVPFIAIATAALMAVAPSGLATWSAFGAYEPDTPYDGPTLMWQDKPGEIKNRVYFNAFSTFFDQANPNVAALETRNEIPTLESHQAILGVWIDCNGDGYVGMAEGALREYRNELLLDKTLCPPVTGSEQRWTEGAHNYNGWVVELVPIAGKVEDESASTRDKRVYKDSASMVWGDYGQPDQPSTESGGGTCALTPFPRGTWGSTGAFLNYALCGTGALGAWNTAVGAAGDPLGLTFPDEDDARGSWADVPTFGSEDSQYSAVHVADCSQDPTLRVGDELNESGLGEATADETGGGALHNVAVYPVPSSPVGNTANPTIPGTYNETNEALRGDCDTTNDRGADFYGDLLGEGDFNSVPVVGKAESDWNFDFAYSNRGGFPVSLLAGWRGPAGANEGDVGTYTGGSSWYSPSSVVKLPATVRLRTDLDLDDPSNSTANPGPAAAYWLSFYAYVGGETLARGLITPGGTGSYGSAQCGSQTSGIHNGWECNTANWNRNADGTPVPQVHPLAVPGQIYNLRDVDCYDGGNNLGLGLGTPFYGDDPCP